MTKQNRKLAMIHIAKKQLGMNDDDYRSFLRQYNVSSAKELTPTKLDRALDDLAKLGFEAKKPKRAGTSPAIKNTPLLSKINALLADMKLPWNYANAIARQMYRQDLVNCHEAELHSIVVALLKRQQKESGNG